VSAGLLITLAAGGVNAVLGSFLIRVGRRHRSMTLEADGHHVLSDFWTSLGAAIGLGLVQITGLAWLDPLVAILMAIGLLVTGGRLVRRAAAGLLDEEDPELLQRLVQVIEPSLGQGIIRLHEVRAIRAGRVAHISAHLVVPEFWTVEQAHDRSESLAAGTLRDLGGEAEITFHSDPCHRAYCAMCDIAACPVRRAAFTGRPQLTVDEIVQPDRG
jgi:cation diffusion facilitator family transporter